MIEWEGMPEFIQEKQEPYAKIIIRCETEEDRPLMKWEYHIR